MDQKCREADAQETALRIALDAARVERAELDARMEALRGDIARTGDRIENVEKSVASEQPDAEAKELPELRARSPI
ncbi:MAG: hypothetical protein HC841_07545 [Verrucomicrobiae bacterium]|nr:hypothetical protein [Verrucomicrobiae bacterium]